MTILQAILHALTMAFAMGWEILWALILGFFISGVIQAIVSHTEMAKLLPDDRPRSILRASLLGAASSSCSYAAVAITRSIIRKGGNFNAAMAFQFASTNLVIELGIVLAVLIGWRFTAATWAGGVIMIVLLVVLLRLFFRRRLVEQATAQAEKGIPGKMEGHAEMDMAVTEGSLWRRLTSREGFTAISHYFVMDWASLWVDLIGGLLIAGALAAWVPASVWSAVFLTHHTGWAKVIGPLIGPLVAMLSFVCSIGNVPLAAVLWNGGASFGGVIAFIFADLIVLPILDIYRRYYGLKPAAVLFLIFYAAMALAGYAIEFLFGWLHLIPAARAARVIEAGVSWNYTTWLNLGFLVLAAVLLWRFFRTGGPAMLRAMEAPSSRDHACGHTGDKEAVREVRSS